MKNSVKQLGFAVVSPVIMNQKESDKNGLQPVMLRPVAGTIPNKFVLSGTVAANENLEPGKAYLVNILERDEDPTYGRQFSFQNLGAISTMDIIDAKAKLGNAKLLSDVEVEIEAATASESAKLEKAAAIA